MPKSAISRYKSGAPVLVFAAHREHPATEYMDEDRKPGCPLISFLRELPQEEDESCVYLLWDSWGGGWEMLNNPNPEEELWVIDDCGVVELGDRVAEVLEYAGGTGPAPEYLNVVEIDPRDLELED